MDNSVAETSICSLLPLKLTREIGRRKWTVVQIWKKKLDSRADLEEESGQSCRFGRRKWTVVQPFIKWLCADISSIGMSNHHLLLRQSPNILALQGRTITRHFSELCRVISALIPQLQETSLATSHRDGLSASPRCCHPTLS